MPQTAQGAGAAARAQTGRLARYGLAGAAKTLQQLAVLQLFHDRPESPVLRGAPGDHLGVAVLQVLGQFLDDFGLAAAFELQPAQPLADGLVPIRHTRSP